PVVRRPRVRRARGGDRRAVRQGQTRRDRQGRGPVALHPLAQRRSAPSAEQAVNRSVRRGGGTERGGTYGQGGEFCPRRAPLRRVVSAPIFLPEDGKVVKIHWKCLLFLALLTCAVGGMRPQDACADSPRVKESEVVVGGLFSLTGGWSTLGQSSEAALEIAVEDVNAYLSRLDARIRFAALIEDTQLIPELALEKLRALTRQKVRIVLGPQSSAEVARLKDFADANDVLIISQSSTAGTLTIAGDNVFRFTPSDDLEGEAVAALMRADGVKTIVPLWRDDPGNSGLHEATTKDFQALGGRVEGGVEYSPSTQDFSSAVAAVSAQVSAARMAAGDNAAVAGYLAACDEAAATFQLAQGDAVLASTRWYGSDGVALSGVLLSDPVAATFAERVGYPNPLFGLDEAAAVEWE